MELQTSEDPDDAQPDDPPATMVIPLSAAALSQEVGTGFSYDCHSLVFQ